MITGKSTISLFFYNNQRSLISIDFYLFSIIVKDQHPRRFPILSFLDIIVAQGVSSVGSPEINDKELGGRVNT